VTIPQPGETVTLIDPVEEMEDEYRTFLDEFIAAGEEGLLHHLTDDTDQLRNTIRRLKNRAAGFDLPEGWVPCSAFWLVSDVHGLLGEIHIRHRLTPALEDCGGHIGYMMRPSRRRHGYGTAMLALGLEKSRAHGLTRVLVTCDAGNVASARVIEKNAGRLASQSQNWGGRMTLRYWIDLA
jgi:predicted acetyltransferase